jgi:hypothetical protein
MLLALTIFLALKLKKKKQRENKSAIIEQPRDESEWKPPVTAYHDVVSPVELNGESAPVELGNGSGDVSELADGRKTPVRT